MSKSKPRPAGAKITVTFEGADPDDLRENLADVVLAKMLKQDYDPDTGETIEEPQSIVEMVNRRLDKKVEKAVDECVESLVQERADGVVKATLDKIIAEGVGEFDSYGKRTRLIPWEDFIREKALRRDQYRSRDFGTLAQESVDALLKGKLAGVMAEVEQKIRAEIDSMLVAKLKDAVRKGAGL